MNTQLGYLLFIDIECDNVNRLIEFLRRFTPNQKTPEKIKRYSQYLDANIFSLVRMELEKNCHVVM